MATKAKSEPVKAASGPEVAMMDPDSGETYMIPPEAVAEAHLHGFQPALRMADENGDQYWIPASSASEAQENGLRSVRQDGTPYPAGQTPMVVGKNAAGQPIWGNESDLKTKPETGVLGQAKNFLSGIGDVLQGAVTGTEQFLDPRATPEEIAEGRNGIYDQLMRYPERLVAPQVQEAEQFAENVNQGQPYEALRHAVGAAIPMLGPQGTEAGTQAAQQVAEGNPAGAAGTVAGNILLVPASEMAGEEAGFAGRAARLAPDVLRGRFREMVAPRARLETPSAPGQMSPLDRYRAAKDMGVNLPAGQAVGTGPLNVAQRITERSMVGRPAYERTFGENLRALHQSAGQMLDEAHPEDVSREELGNRVKAATSAHRAALKDEPGQLAAAQQLLNDIHPQDMTRTEFGATAKSAIEDHLKSIRDRENEIYEDLDQRIGDKRPKVRDIRQSARNIYDANKRFYDEHPEALTGGDARAWKWIKDLAGVDETGKMKPVSDQTGLRSWTDLQTTRSHLLDLTRGKEVIGDNAARWLKTLTGKIDETMTSAQKTPGMTPEDVTDFRTANNLHRSLKETYDNNQSPFYWLLRDDPSGVAERINGLSPENFKRLQDNMAEIGRSDVVSQAQRQHAVRLLDPKGSGTIDLEGLSGRWKNADKPKMEGILAPDHMVALGDLADKVHTGTPYDASKLAEVADADNGTEAYHAIFTPGNGALKLAPADLKLLEQADPDLVPQLKRHALANLFDPSNNSIIDPSKFDMKNFAKRWGKPDKELLSSLFNPDEMKKVDDLAEVSREVHANENTSGTSNVLQPVTEAKQLASGVIGGTAGAFAGGPVGAGIGAAAGPIIENAAKWRIAKAVNDPAVVESVMEHPKPMELKEAAKETVATPPPAAAGATAVGLAESQSPQAQQSNADRMRELLARRNGAGQPQPASGQGAPSTSGPQAGSTSAARQEGVSTPPNGGDVTTLEPTAEERNLKPSEAATKPYINRNENQTGSRTGDSSGGGVIQLKNPQGQRVWPEQATTVPAGATHEVLNPDGKTVVGHIVAGKYVPLQAGGNSPAEAPPGQ